MYETSTVQATEIQADEKLLEIKSDAESIRKSNTSKTSKGSKIRLAMAQLKMEQLKEEQNLQNKQRVLEMKRLQMEGEILKAHMEVEQAEMEAQLNEDTDDSDLGSQILPGFQRQSPQEVVNEYLRSYQPNPRGFVPTLHPTPRQPQRERHTSHEPRSGPSDHITTATNPPPITPGLDKATRND